MWYFNSPRVVFGEDALSYLGQLKGNRAFIVTDPVMVKLGFLGRVQKHLDSVGIDYASFTEVEPDPSMLTVHRCAQEINAFCPDWIIGLGGGSSLDAAKIAWFIYEKPEVDLNTVSAIEEYGLRTKARFLTIPTTAGSGAEVTAAAIITDTDNSRKMEISCFELIADLAIIDPYFSSHMPAQLSADTGLDVLTHAVEGYSSSWANDFSDALCLHAATMVFTYLPRCVENEPQDIEAREKMANAASIGALGMGNSHIALAHALGHAAGTLLELPHGRVTALFLPYCIEFTAYGGAGRYQGLAKALDLPCATEQQAAAQLAGAIRSLMQRLSQPLTLQQAGITPEHFAQNQESLVEYTMMDLALVAARRIPRPDEVAKLLSCAYTGRSVEF